MNIICARSFTTECAWDALDIANMDGIATHLYWTDQPYRWHVNSSEEVFVMLDSTADIHCRGADEEKVATLEPSDIFFTGVGCEYVTHPRGEARVLVVKKAESV